ncbi:hypothetical protein [Orenia marismortui]|uniref:hypothetical protein n=1 Tax=Orenia marismortui TaxID=46469 RepID=UPI000379F16D|nr:hypothetical protein [Orenia marismortui]
MGRRLLDQETKTFSGMELTKYVNNAKGTEFDNLEAAIQGLGLTVAGIVITNPMASAITTTIGVGVSLSTVYDAVIAAIDDSDLESTIDRMKEGNSLRVTTKFYEWSFGDGNHVTYYSNVSYTIV